ncbi:MAG: DUF58 domain-containing protein [Bryobacteraceae bacterium]
MIAPRSRLLWLVAAALLPGAAVAAFAPWTTAIAVIVAAAALCLAVGDALLSRDRLDGFRVLLPDIVRLAKDRESAFEVRVERTRDVEEKLRLGFAFPSAIVPVDEEVVTVLPAGSRASRLDWRCTPRQRGSYRLDRCYLESASRLGLWSIRTSTAVDCEFRVYPNLLSDRESAASLLLNRGQAGAHTQRQLGQGREFEKLREYSSGDSFDEIHWKATARRGHPITKVFQIEKTQEAYVLIDSSRLSARQSGGDSILERFITAGLLLGVAAERQGDLFGLISFSDRVERFVPAKSGKSHYAACRDALYTVKERLVSPDFYELCTFIRLRLRRRALLLVLTELDDPVLAEAFERSVRLISRKHIILVNALKPAGLRPLFQDPEATSDADVYKDLASHMRWQKLQELSRRLQQLGIRFSLLEPEKLALQLTSQYRSVKQRQLL